MNNVAVFTLSPFERHARRLLNATCVRRTRDAVDLPDLSGEGDDVRGIPDELERGRPIQTVCDDGECAVPVDLDELAGVRHRITRVNIRVDCAVREGVETAAAKFHVDSFHARPGAGSFFRRERGDDFFKARITAERVPEGQQF